MAKVRVDAHDGGVRLVTLTDPDRRNAMDEQMGAELIAAAAELREDASVRAVVVTGEGSAFCAGADLPALFGDPERGIVDVHDGLQRYYKAFFSVLDLPQPTIAAVNGPAVGAGLNLALCCDVRLAGTGATFGATFSKIGLHPGGGCTWFLVRALGPARALQTLLLGEPLDAVKAQDWGLAEDGGEDVVAAALDLAGRFAAVDGALARSIKRGVGIAVETNDLGAVLEYESWAQAASASSDQLQAWVAKFRR